uniref:eIF-4F 25 kDa subunit n=1 Tax=Musca domestica TaxID=7370 RepID=T1PBP2_MUSDO
MVVTESEKSSATPKENSPAPAAQATPAAGRPEAKEENNKETEEVRQEHLIKHPLQNTWTLWYLENDRSKSWEDMQNEITSFDTVEDFWSLYNHIKPPSDIKIGSDYSLFKKGIRPMWEDAANKQGGRWVITLNRSPKAELDNLWLDVILCLIGEAFDHSDQICGAVVNIRQKAHKISIWTANGNNEEAAIEIGHKLRDSLRLGRQNLHYQLHKDTMVKTGSNVKSIYTL